METLTRIVENLFARLEGPFHFRIILQPVMAMIFATLDGIKDGKIGKTPYLWDFATNPEHRRNLLKVGWEHFGKIFVLAIVLDIVYQWKVNHHINPAETLIVALLLAVVPYVLIRGPVNRAVRLFRKKE
jgi:hypothetical protein